MRTLFIALFLISGLFQSVCGQKVKYKDLFPMLDAARYEEAEPFLRQFLVQEPDHANAALQMGLLLENKARETDILKAYERIQELTDSAVIYYSKFNSMVSEKELKKNDEYYQSYNRRDLRTGKFEIKLEDVKYDVDDKVEELNKYSATVGEANEQMENAIRQYQTAKSSFIYLSRLSPDKIHFC